MKFLFRPKQQAETADVQGDHAALDALIAEGNSREDDGDVDGALELYLRAASMTDPSYWRACLNVGNALRRLDRLPEAIEQYREATRLAPDQAGPHLNLGTALLRSGDPAGAERSYRAAIDLRPTWPDAWFGLARALEDSPSADAAVAAYRTGLEHAPGHAAAAALARLLMRRGQGREAREALDRALATDGSAGAILSAYAEMLRQAGEAELATEYCRAALARHPDDLKAFSDYLFTLNLVDGIDPGVILDEHRRYGHLAAARAPRVASRARDRRERLRVGYVSPDFRRHPMACFILPVLENHDRNAVDVFCYHDHDGRDEVTERIQSCADHWRDVAGSTDRELTERIASDGIDILVDLAGHTSGNRLPVFARKPAPVQFTWLGYLCTTGVGAIDYRICDARTDPPGAERWQVEAPARMPHSQWCYQPQVELPPQTRLPMLENGYCTFGSFNQPAKLNPGVIETWARLLVALPRSRLRVVGVTDDVHQASIRSTLEAFGVAESRVDVLGRIPIEDYFECFRTVDIALDTFPYNGATTTCDALIVGVPVATIEGERAISRGCASLLATLGLDEWIAPSRARFVPMLQRLVDDPVRLATLRDALPARMRASPLMDARRFAADLERIYREAWSDSPRTP
jgi:predicted O-linked N-acetylglucosamine transferase (SPINDLY family)